MRNMVWRQSEAEGVRMSRSFGLDAETALEELREEFERFRKDSLDKKLARECAMKVWHLCDHVFDGHGAILPFNGLDDFQEHVRNACPALAHLQVVCNATKHGENLRRTGRVRRAYRRGGAFSQAFSRAFDTSRLEIELTDGTTVDFEDAVEAAVAYWDGFFSRHGLA